MIILKLNNEVSSGLKFDIHKKKRTENSAGKKDCWSFQTKSYKHFSEVKGEHE